MQCRFHDDVLSYSDTPWANPLAQAGNVSSTADTAAWLPQAQALNAVMPCKLSTHGVQKFRYETVLARRLFPALHVVSFRHCGQWTLRHRRGQQARRGQRSWSLTRRVVPMNTLPLLWRLGTSRAPHHPPPRHHAPWLDPAAPFPLLPQEVLDLLDELRRVGLLGLERAPCLATCRVIVLL